MGGRGDERRVRPAARAEADARPRDDGGDGSALVLAATDPAQPYGAALPGPKRRDDERKRPARAAGAYVVLVGAEPVLYVERGGKGMQTLADARDPRLRTAFEALAAFVRAGRIKKLDLEKADGEAVVGSDLEPLLVELGFRVSPRRLTLTA